MNAKLRLIYNKEFVSPDKYLLRVTVEPVNTDPEVLENCLVVLKGSGVPVPTEELLLRVATYAELVTAPLPGLPEFVDRFASAGHPVLANGDVITITGFPQTWTTYFSEVGPVVRTVVDDTDPTSLVVDTPFPAFGKDLVFTVNGGLEYSDGLANRDYTALTGSNFLTNDFVYEYSTFDAVNNAMIAFDAAAQTLVNDMNTDNYSGIVTEDYV